MGGVPEILEGVNMEEVRRVADLKEANSNFWNTDRLHNFFEEGDVSEILKLEAPDFQYPEKLIWLGNKSGVFIVISCFQINFGYREEVKKIWKKLWSLIIHDRLKVFIWRVAHNILPTKEVLKKRFGSFETTCSVCGDASETVVHILKECQGIKAVGFGSRWGLRLSEWKVETLEELISSSVEPGNTNLPRGSDRQCAYAILITLMYCAWNFRNDLMFGRGKIVEEVIVNFERMVDDFAIRFDHSKQERVFNQRMAWTPPIVGNLKINTDAAFKKDIAAVALVYRNTICKVVLLAG